MAIKIIKPGLLTTVQDIGRRGYQKDGIVVSGAMDNYALRIANILVGNKDTESTLEVTLVGPQIEFLEDTLIAITGGDNSPRINGLSVQRWKPIYVKKGCILSFGNYVEGCRSYIAIAGGIEVPMVLSSASTYIRAQLGGLNGAAITTNQIIPIKKPSCVAVKQMEQLSKFDGRFVQAKWYVSNTSYIRSNIVKVIKGANFDDFDEKSKKTFFTSQFKVTPQSDRMGYRMFGAGLQCLKKKELISEAVCPGTIQVPPSGLPIILLADAQTIGGYPKIANVIGVDLSILAQKKPGEGIYFKEVSIAEAQKEYIEREKSINKLRQSIALYVTAA